MPSKVIYLMIGTPKTLLVESIQGAPDGLHRPDNFIRNDVCLRIDRLRIGDSILVDMKERLVADESELPREILQARNVQILRDVGRLAPM